MLPKYTLYLLAYVKLDTQKDYQGLGSTNSNTHFDVVKHELKDFQIKKHTEVFEICFIDVWYIQTVITIE